MAAFIDENTQFVDNDGKPIVKGKIYIGTKGLDPVTNPISIYADRSLTVLLDNPQLLDADGRSANKIWIPGLYSFRVDNTNDVQQLIDLDAGDISATGTTKLFNIQGTNAITATASPTIESYVDGEIYVFTAANTNTGAMTLSIDGLGSKAITLSGGALTGDDIISGISYIVAYNEPSDGFDLVSAAGGISTWSPSVSYTATGKAYGSDGLLYFSRLSNNLNNNPVTGTGNQWIGSDQIRNATAGGTVDAITATFIPAIGALSDGLACRVRAAGANTSLTPTFSPNSLTAKTIVKQGNKSLEVGNISTDLEMLLVYNSANDNWELLNTTWLASGSVQTATSETEVEFTGLPPGVKKIILMLSSLSTDGSSEIIVQIGDSVGYEITGYLGSAGVAGTTYTDGFGLDSQHSPTHILHGQMQLSLLDEATNTWVSSGVYSRSDNGVVEFGAGSKILSGTLDKIRITMQNGSDIFDSGVINILYEI